MVVQNISRWKIVDLTYVGCSEINHFKDMRVVIFNERAIDSPRYPRTNNKQTPNQITFILQDPEQHAKYTTIIFKPVPMRYYFLEIRRGIDTRKSVGEGISASDLRSRISFLDLLRKSPQTFGQEGGDLS
jgi:hypothetical protein